jgi:hypothetical protein
MSIIVRCFLLNHPSLPHSPDLTASYLFLFPKIKAALKGRRFQDVEIFKNITAELSAVSLDAFDDFCESVVVTAH